VKHRSCLGLAVTFLTSLPTTALADPIGLHPLELRRAYSAQLGVAGTYARSIEGDSSGSGVGPHLRANVSIVELVRSRKLTGQTEGFIVQDWCAVEMGLGYLSRGESDARATKPWIDFHVDFAVRALAPIRPETELLLIPGARTGLNTARSFNYYGTRSSYLEYFLAGAIRHDLTYLEGAIGRGGNPSSFADGLGTQPFWSLSGTLAQRFSRQGMAQYVGIRGEIIAPIAALVASTRSMCG